MKVVTETMNINYVVLGNRNYTQLYILFKWSHYGLKRNILTFCIINREILKPKENFYEIF